MSGWGEFWLIKGSGLLRILTSPLALLQDLSPPFFLSLLHRSHPASVCSLDMSSPFLHQELCTGCSLCLDCPSLISYHSVLTSIVTSSERPFQTSSSLFIPIPLPAFWAAFITFGNYFINLFIFLSYWNISHMRSGILSVLPVLSPWCHTTFFTSLDKWNLIGPSHLGWRSQGHSLCPQVISYEVADS